MEDATATGWWMEAWRGRSIGSQRWYKVAVKQLCAPEVLALERFERHLEFHYEGVWRVVPQCLYHEKITLFSIRRKQRRVFEKQWKELFPHESGETNSPGPSALGPVPPELTVQADDSYFQMHIEPHLLPPITATSFHIHRDQLPISILTISLRLHLGRRRALSFTSVFPNLPKPNSSLNWSLGILVAGLALLSLLLTPNPDQYDKADPGQPPPLLERPHHSFLPR